MQGPESPYRRGQPAKPEEFLLQPRVGDTSHHEAADAAVHLRSQADRDRQISTLRGGIQRLDDRIAPIEATETKAIAARDRAVSQLTAYEAKRDGLAGEKQELEERLAPLKERLSETQQRQKIAREMHRKSKHSEESQAEFDARMDTIAKEKEKLRREIGEIAPRLEYIDDQLDNVIPVEVARYKKEQDQANQQLRGIDAALENLYARRRHLEQQIEDIKPEDSE